MSDINIQRVLADMRALAAEASAGTQAAAPGAADAPEFAELLKESIDKVNATQQAAAAAAAQFESGDPSVDLAEVMIELQKASLSFKAMTEVRNKLVDAYREIMSMPI